MCLNLFSCDVNVSVCTNKVIWWGGRGTVFNGVPLSKTVTSSVYIRQNTLNIDMHIKSLGFVFLTLGLDILSLKHLMISIVKNHVFLFIVTDGLLLTCSSSTAHQQAMAHTLRDTCSHSTAFLGDIQELYCLMSFFLPARCLFALPSDHHIHINLLFFSHYNSMPLLLVFSLWTPPSCFNINSFK